MGERRAREVRRRAREFEAFVAGAAGRLLHAATLLTGEPFGSAPAAEELLVGALSRTYADWDQLRGEDPYEHTRRDLAAHFAHTARRYRRPRGGMLAGLPPQERLILMLRLYEGVAEEQVAAALGLPVERVRTLCTRAMATVLSGAAQGAGKEPGARASPAAASAAGTSAAPRAPVPSPEPPGATRRAVSRAASGAAALLSSRLVSGPKPRRAVAAPRAVPHRDGGANPGGGTGPEGAG